MHYRRQPGCPTLGQHKADFACGSTSLLSRINIGINLSLTLPRQKSQPALQQAFASAPQPSCERGRGTKGAWALPVFQGGMGRRKNETRSPWHLQAWQTNTPWRRGAALREGKQLNCQVTRPGLAHPSLLITYEYTINIKEALLQLLID